MAASQGQCVPTAPHKILSHLQLNRLSLARICLGRLRVQVRRPSQVSAEYYDTRLEC
jgi:hypothetical protein